VSGPNLTPDPRDLRGPTPQHQHAPLLLFTASLLARRETWRCYALTLPAHSFLICVPAGPCPIRQRLQPLVASLRSHGVQVFLLQVQPVE
jgi:hypothetical protein